MKKYILFGLGLLPWVWMLMSGEKPQLHTNNAEKESAFINTDCSVCDSVSVIDSLGLVALYNSTNGTNWTNPWNLDMPVCVWEGVALSVNCRVTSIDLQNKNLIGTIPFELGDLSSLSSLKLNGNELEGQIPNELGNLTSLIFLTLDYNKLEGTIPPVLGNLSNLLVLYLDGNELEGQIPFELGELLQLNVLRLNRNNLEGTIPVELGNLENLTFLDLGLNNLSGTVPDTLQSLTNLESLILWHNQLSGKLPSGLATIPNLTSIRLNNNNLTGCFPEEYMTFCSITYSFTDNIGLPWNGDLEFLCMGEEQIGVPCDDGNPNTENDVINSNCDCAGVNLSACIQNDSLALVALYDSTNGDGWDNNTDWLVPEQPVSSWHGVEVDGNGCVITLKLPNNNLTGPLPDELGNLTNLIVLNLSENDLTGSIPSSLCNLTNLKNLTFWENDLQGSIPSCIGNLTTLERLNLSNNNFDADVIPSSFGNLENLQSLSLQECSLISPIPDTLSNLTELRSLFLGNNSFSESIPNWIYDLPKLESLILWSSGFTGSISDSIGNLDSLRLLYLNNNSLVGTIPETLGSLDSLRDLRIANCGLGGSIPATLGNLQKLHNLALNDNELSGEIPVELGMLNNSLDSLLLFNNNLSGCYPPEVMTLCNIINFDCLNNPMLPWEGDVQIWCMGEEQIGAPCDDGNPDTVNDIINSNCICTEVNTCVENDSLVLVALYESTNGSGWIDTTNWLVPDSSIGTWYGVSVNDDGCVTSIVLNSNQLSGVLPAELGNLEDLTYLDLTSNEISGSIPSTFGVLLNLETLRLHTNLLNGTIPPELGNLSNMVDLLLANNELSGPIPSELGNLSSISTLSIYNNNLSGNIPADFSNLSTMYNLILYDNCLSGEIPSELSVLPNLSMLNLSRNCLIGAIPPELGDLANLSRLNLSFNSLTGAIPSEIGNITDLFELLLHNNSLSGEIPPTLGNMSNLDFLRLNDNNLSGCYPIELFSKCNIQTLNLLDNPQLPREGDISFWCMGEDQIGAPCNDNNAQTENDVINSNCECLGINICRQNDSLTLVALYSSTDSANWTNSWDLNSPMNTWYGVTLNEDGCVSRLDLGENNLNGSIPPELGNMINLEDLRLDQNNLNGSIPIELGNLSNLEKLYIYGSNLNGPIPESLGNLSNLERLYLWSNQLSGNIPETLGNLSNLIELWLYSNHLEGEIPATLGELDQLISLNLRHNNLSGGIPDELGNLNSLEVLTLSNNELSDSIPATFGNLDNLTYITLEGNLISGNIPLALGDLDNIETLLLGNNELVGNIPDTLGSLTTLIVLRISNNELEGIIPANLGSLSNLVNLSLDVNNLSGEIPPELGSLSELLTLSLYNNNLTGEIPPELGELSSLSRLLLYDNNLRGCYPPEILVHCNISEFDCINNPMLPWEGDVQAWCMGEEQIGALCDDGNPDTVNDIINSNCDCEGVNACVQNDSLALVALYESTNGAGWNDNTNWLVPDSSIATWHGVEVNDDGCVIRLILENNNLSGTLPSQLGNLSQLINLTISGHHIVNLGGISGQIPPTLGNLSHLEILNLSDNLLEGSIPCELSQLTILRRLWLSSQGLSGTLPPELGSLSSLSDIRIADNNFSGKLPTWLGELSNPNLILIGDNNFRGCYPNNYINLCDATFNATGNSSLPSQGDWEWFQMWCADEVEQIGTPCDDNNPNTENDVITENCNCIGESLALLCLTDTKAALSPFIAFKKEPDNKNIMGAFDIDGDGDRDVMAMTLDNSIIEIYLYEDGELNLVNELAVPDFVHQFNVGASITTRPFENTFFQDFNNDGIKDLLLSFSTFQTCFGNKIRIYWGDHCSAQFFDENNYAELFTSTNGCYVAFAEDFDQDGDVDVYADRRLFGNQNYFFENDGFGNFVQVFASNTYRDYRFYFTDFTRDGFNDQIGNSRSTDNGFYLKEGDGSTNFTEIHSALSGKLMGREHLLNWDNDPEDNMEIVFQNFTDFQDQNRIEVVYWDELNTSVAFDSIILLHQNSDFIEIADWNQDGLEDIFVSELTGVNSYNLAVYLNDGASGFADRQCIVEDVPYNFIDVFDFTGTGDFKVRAGNVANDSIFLFDLIPLPQLTDIDTTLCANESFAIGSMIYDMSGSYSGTLSNSFGCDSIVNLTLDFHPEVPEENLTDFFCEGSIYIYDGNGVEYVTPDAYEITLMNNDGCDSIVNLTLEWHEIDTGIIDPLLCIGDSVDVNGITYNEENPTGVETLAGESLLGCDSIVTVNLRFVTGATTGFAEAGENETICDEFEAISLSASPTPDSILGEWMNTNVTDPFSPTTAITDLYDGENIFIWTLSTAQCENYVSDSVIIAFYSGLPFALNDTFVGDIDTPLTGDFLSNDDLAELANSEVVFPVKIIEEETTLSYDLNDLEFPTDSTFVFTPNINTCGDFVFEYIIQNADCPELRDTARVYIKITPANDMSIAAPNVITPNGDKYNEFFVIPKLFENPDGFPDNKLMIFNEWGTLVYEAKPYRNDWNGVNQDGEPLPQAAYYYFFEYGDGKTSSGRVAILK